MVAENITIQEKLYFLTEDSPVQIECFIRDLVENRGVGKRVDEYVSHHVGISALSKMGGSAMQVARRLVSIHILYLLTFLLCILQLVTYNYTLNLYSTCNTSSCTALSDSYVILTRWLLHL